MSSYLTFRKNGITLCSFSRSTDVYQALSDYAPYDKWSEVKQKQLDQGIETLKQDREGYQNRIATEKEVISNLHDSEAIRESIGYINDLKEEIENINICINYIELLEMILNEDTYVPPEDEDDPNYTTIESKMEWTVG